MESKTCTKCGEVKPLEQFEKNAKCVNGRGGRCKKCRNEINSQYRVSPEAKESARRTREKHGEKYKARYQDKYKSKYKETLKRGYRRWHKQNPFARKAHRAVSDAIESGILNSVKSLPCSQCGNTAAHYHHHLGYEPQHWLSVIPLCVSCHRAEHAKAP